MAKSLRAGMAENLNFLPVSEKVRFIPNDFLSRYEPSFFMSACLRQPGRRQDIGPALVTRWGVVVSAGRLHPAGWDYDQQGMASRVRHGWRWLRAKAHAPRIPTAFFPLPHLIFGGTYGDYWLEILSGLCCHHPPAGSVVLLFGEDQMRFAAEDFREKHWTPYLVGPEGVWVEELSLLEPPQYYGNFTPEVIGKIRQAFPDRCSESSPVGNGKKVYMSRRGYVRTSKMLTRRPGVNPQRTLANHEEIEQFLRSEGFEILPLHCMTNAQIRQAIAGSEVVVAEHGAAMFHLIWSPPDKIVELVAPSWFLPCFIKLSRHLKTRSHVVLSAGPDHRLDIGLLASSFEN